MVCSKQSNEIREEIKSYNEKWEAGTVEIKNDMNNSISEFSSDINNLKGDLTKLQFKSFKVLNFRVGAYESGIFKTNSTRRITSDVGYVAAGTTLLIEANGQYYSAAVYAEAPNGNEQTSIQNSGWTQSSKITIEENGYLVISVANAWSYNTSTDIVPSDYAMDITVELIDKIAYDIAKEFNRYVGEMLTSKDFVQGEYENGAIYSTTLRITCIVPVKKQTNLIINNTNEQYIIITAVPDNEDRFSIVSEWTKYNSETIYKINYDGYLVISVANAWSYNTSTDIVPSDYDCDIVLSTNHNTEDIMHNTEDIMHNTKAIASILGGYKCSDFEKSGVEKGIIIPHSDRRLHYFIETYCESGSSFELVSNKNYFCIDIYENPFAERQDIIESSGWLMYGTKYTINNGGYVCILYANGNSYANSTSISVSDFDGYVLYESYIKNKLSEKDLEERAFVSSYNKIGSVEEHVKNYSQLFKNIGSGDGFLFFTDMHIIYKEGWENRLKECMAYIEQIANTTPVSFVLNGGDWLGSYNTQDEALYMLSRISGTMRSKFGDRFAMALGNHDTNYQGSISEDDSMNKVENINARLSQTAIDNTYSALRRKSYYRYEAPTFALYIFDTGIEISALTTDYYRNQVKWFAESLKTEKMEHIVIGMHIIYNGKNLLDMANELTKCAKAYNERGSYSYGGETYNYVNMMNKVAFAIGGHNHADSNGIINSIPYVLTVNASPYGSYSTLPFDLCAVDWDNSKLYMYRCELGKDGTTREIDIISN